MNVSFLHLRLLSNVSTRRDVNYIIRILIAQIWKNGHEKCSHEFQIQRGTNMLPITTD